MRENKKKIYGLIGYPVKHSFSAAMHNAAFLHLRHDAEYKLFEVSPDELEYFFARLPDSGIKGINVTIPHKEKALRFVRIDSNSRGVREIEAINTVRVNENNTLTGFNTDWTGFARHVQELGASVDQTALIGAGGGAKAVAFSLVKKGAKEICVYDIDQEKSRLLCAKIKKWNPHCQAEAVESVSAFNLKKKSLLINASPIGMKPEDPLLISAEMLKKDLFVYDLIYNPGETRLLKLAVENGLRTSNGLGMLLYQGVLAFEHWTGEKAPVEIMRKALLKELEKCHK